MKKILFIGVICLLCSIAAFSQSKKKWEQTQALNSISAYQDFINQYPDSKYTVLAKQQLEQLKEQEKKRTAIEAQQVASEKALKAQKIAAEEAESSTDFPNSIFDKNILSDAEMENIKKQLVLMSNPFTLKDLYDFATSDKRGDEACGGDWNTISKLCTFKYAKIGRKVEIVSTTKCLLNSDMVYQGFMTIFNTGYASEYNPKRLFTLYKPTKNNSAGINFEKIIIWETYSTPKNTYILKDGKWYNVM
jgi:hypothetical protein